VSSANSPGTTHQPLAAGGRHRPLFLCTDQNAIHQQALVLVCPTQKKRGPAGRVDAPSRKPAGSLSSLRALPAYDEPCATRRCSLLHPSRTTTEASTGAPWTIVAKRTLPGRATTSCSNVLHQRSNLHELDGRTYAVETGDSFEKLAGEERFGRVF